MFHRRSLVLLFALFSSPAVAVADHQLAEYLASLSVTEYTRVVMPGEAQSRWGRGPEVAFLLASKGELVIRAWPGQEVVCGPNGESAIPITSGGYYLLSAYTCISTSSVGGRAHLTTLDTCSTHMNELFVDHFVWDASAGVYRGVLKYPMPSLPAPGPLSSGGGCVRWWGVVSGDFTRCELDEAGGITPLWGPIGQVPYTMQRYYEHTIAAGATGGYRATYERGWARDASTPHETYEGIQLDSYCSL